MRIKVCGMTRPEQVMALDEMEVPFAGFIFYPKSPRYVFKHMSAPDMKKMKLKKTSKVGVFVNTTVDDILRTVDECGLYIVQLHGDETPRFCEQVSNYVTTVKAFRLGENDPIEWMIKPYIDVVDMFLFDTEGAGYGGTGKKFNWEALKGKYINKPFFLSGGIQPEDTDALKKFAVSDVAKDLFAVDINSKFEVAPGLKDMDKVKAFVEQLR